MPQMQKFQPGEYLDWEEKLVRERLDIAEGERYTARVLCERLRDRAGDIRDIFPEFIDDRAAAKAENMRAGIRKFLEPGE